MALSEDELLAMADLEALLSTEARTPLERLENYYEGTWRLDRLGLAVPPELEQFVTLVNWPRVTVNEVERRCDVEGFRLLPDDADPDDDLWAIWQANNLDEVSQLGHLEALKLGRAYGVVGARADDEPLADFPLITMESPLEMSHRIDPRTREVRDALKIVSDTARTLYFPNLTIQLEKPEGSSDWVDASRDEHNLGVCPVVPYAVNASLRNGNGVSEMADVISLTDAAARALTNAQVATEALAVPQRYVLGASPKDFVDQEGKPLPAWESYFGAIWALQNDQAKIGEFSAADLKNFETIVNHYAALVSGVSGLPTRYYGLATVNPPSEGSIIADEVRLIMNARRKHRTLGGSHERLMRIALMIANEETAETANPDWLRMETLWANPETPTRAQTADAVVKLVSQGILPIEAAWEDLGYSKARIARLKAMRAAQLAEDPLAAAASAFGGGGGAAGAANPGGGTGSNPQADPAPPPGGAPDAEV